MRKIALYTTALAAAAVPIVLAGAGTASAVASSVTVEGGRGRIQVTVTDNGIGTGDYCGIKEGETKVFPGYPVGKGQTDKKTWNVPVLGATPKTVTVVCSGGINTTRTVTVRPPDPIRDNQERQLRAAGLIWLIPDSDPTLD